MSGGHTGHRVRCSGRRKTGYLSGLVSNLAPRLTGGGMEGHTVGHVNRSRTCVVRDIQAGRTATYGAGARSLEPVSHHQHPPASSSGSGVTIPVQRHGERHRVSR